MISKNSATPPIIIIGMHRSGTTMLVRFLEEMGLYVGDRKGKNHEAYFFQHLNNWMLGMSGGRWDHPQPFLEVLKDKHTVKFIADFLRSAAGSPRIISYTGLKKFFLRRSLFNMNIPLGLERPSKHDYFANMA